MLSFIDSIAQVGATHIALKVSVICASFALPLWTLLGIIFECYLVLGDKSYEHAHAAFPRTLLLVVWMCAAASLFGAVAGVIYFLNLEAFLLFGATTIIGSVSYLFFHESLARWWYAPDGPSSTKEDSPGPSECP